MPETPTALALIDQEWTDLAHICRIWRLATESNDGYTAEQLVIQLRRRSLADRIMEAATT